MKFIMGFILGGLVSVVGAYAYDNWGDQESMRDMRQQQNEWELLNNQRQQMQEQQMDRYRRNPC